MVKNVWGLRVFGKEVFHCRNKRDNNVDEIVNCFIDHQSSLVICKKCRKPMR